MRPELVEAHKLLRSQTPEAVEQAIALLQSTVYSFSMKVCGHPEDAQDTMQEVLFRSLGYLAKIEEPQALAVWLYTVTRNRCWRMRRKTAGAPDKLLSLDELMPGEEEMARLLQDASAGPEGLLLRAEEHSLMHRAVLATPPTLRIVLVLHDMEELSTEEVAQVLGLQTGTVRVRLHRARLAARQQMRLLLDGGDASESLQTKRKGARGAKRKCSPQCRALFANLSEYMDGNLAPATCEQMQSHIDSCPSCVAFLHDLRTAIERCRKLETPCDPAVAAHLRSALTREYLRMLLAAESAGSAASGVVRT